jgi:tetratricopeptide (TPR) repeat protein
LAEIESVLQSDPLSIFTRWWLSIMAYLDRRFDRMSEEGRHMIALDAAQFFGYWARGMGSVECGLIQEAVEALEKAHELSGGIPFTQGFLTYVYARAGRPDDARKLLERAHAIAAERYLPPSTLAIGYTGLNDWENAFHWWNQAIEARDPIIMPIKSFAFFDPVRGHPAFQAMLRRMNLA